MTIILVLLLVGTLPFIDNWSHVAGFFFGKDICPRSIASPSYPTGVVSSIIFLPYITFGKWDVRRKRILVLVCMPLLAIMLILAFVLFYNVQNTQFCTWCKYLNCIPYSSNIDCDTQQ